MNARDELTELAVVLGFALATLGSECLVFGSAYWLVKHVTGWPL